MLAHSSSTLCLDSSCHSSRRWTTGWAWLSITAVLICLVGIVAYHIDRSAFYDEAWVVQFARASTLSESLSLAIHDRQPIAMGYLSVMHTLTYIVDGHLWPYRLPSVVAATAIVLITAWQADRWSRIPGLGWGWLACLFLLACPLFQRYATEIKQYLPAAAVSLGLVVATECWTNHPSRIAVWSWFFLAIAAVVTAFATWFTLAGTGMVLFLTWVLRIYWNRIAIQPSSVQPEDVHKVNLLSCYKIQIRLTVMIGLAILVLAAFVHLGFNRHLSGSSVLQEYWADQFLPNDLSWPIAAWHMGANLFEQAWYRYTVPGQLMMALAVAGWLAWLWRQPVAAWAVMATVGVTLAANTAGLWPLGIRINLTLVVLAHLCVLAGPTVILGWIFYQWLQSCSIEDQLNTKIDTIAGQSPSQELVHPKTRNLAQWLGLAATLMLVTATLYETQGADYETANVGGLIQELARHSAPDDLILMTTAAFVNREVTKTQLGVDPVLAPWPQEGAMTRLYLPLIQQHQRGRVWFAAGHHNASLETKWNELGQALSPYGRFEKYWSGKNTALYCFEPTSWSTILKHYNELLQPINQNLDHAGQESRQPSP